jgi:transcriptional regulator with XRE-family HTH domain
MLNFPAQACLTTPPEVVDSVLHMDGALDKEAWKPRLRGVMKERGLKDAEIATLADVSASAVSQWFSEAPGRTKELSAMALLNLCEALNIRERWLVFGEEPRDRGAELTPEIAAAIKLLRSPPSGRPPAPSDPSA